MSKIETSILQQLIQQLENYSKKEEEFDMKLFSVWLYNQSDKTPQKDSSKEVLKDLKKELKGDFNQFFGTPEKQIGFIIYRLAGYIKKYVKIIMDDLPVSTVEEFSFLLDVNHRANPTKSDVINNSFMEYTTAAEIINRLLRLKLLSQKTDKTDKRVRRLSLTKTGKETAFEAAKRMQRVSSLMVGNTDNKKLLSLLETLSKLDSFNTAIINNEQDISFDDLENKYILKNE